MAEFAIRPLTAADAAAVAGWHYPGPYAFYDLDADPGDLAEFLDPSTWGSLYWAADGPDGVLAGFFMFRRAGEFVEIGLGLRPDLTGRGLGAAFLAAGMDYAETAFPGQRLALAVAAFNRRAITVYERAGFRESRRYPHETNGGVHEFVWMTLDRAR